MGICPKKTKTLIRKDTCIPMFIAALFIIDKIWKQPKCPSIDEWIKKKWYIYNGILLNHKKGWNLAFCDNMDEPTGHYAKWNKSVRERQILYDFTYMWNLKKQNKWINITKQKQSCRYKEETGGSRRGGGLGGREK